MQPTYHSYCLSHLFSSYTNLYIIALCGHSGDHIAIFDHCGIWLQLLKKGPNWKDLAITQYCKKRN